jgi:hypothetical protein
LFILLEPVWASHLDSGPASDYDSHLET